MQSAKKISKKEATIQFSQTYFLLNIFFFSILLCYLCFPANIIFLYSPLLLDCRHYKCEVFKLVFIILLCVKPSSNYLDDPVVVEYYQCHFYVDLPFSRPIWNTKILYEKFQMSKVNVPFMLRQSVLPHIIGLCIKLYCWIHTWKRETIISLSKVCLIFNFRSLVITGRTFGKVGKIHSNVAFNCQIFTTFCILEKEEEINWIVCYIRCVHICLNIFFY